MAAGLTFAAALALAAGVQARTVPIPRFSTASPGDPPAPWRVVTLPKLPRHTRFAVVEHDGARVLRVEADGSYANLLLRFDRAPAVAAPVLRWRWRVDALSGATDITRKNGDDVPARVCVLFDLPLDRLSFGDRMALRMGRALFDPGLPAATLCYLWDAQVAPGTWLPNAYTARVMQQVLQRGPATGWKDERRDLRRDFAAAFPAEAANGPVPAIAAIGISADGDTTGARSLAFIGDLELASE
jgi:hypothetical protein